MRSAVKPVVLVGAVWLGCAAYIAAQTDFEWRGQLAAGQSIEIKGINGDVRAVAGRGNEVEVTATRSARRSNPADVRFEVAAHTGGVTICAIYPAASGQPANECQAGPGGRFSSSNNDTVADFTVRVPPGIGFIARTVNGSVDGEALQANAEGYAVNGSIRLATTGLARATTVNGSITASMGRADWPEGASFKTVNGEITLSLPPAVNADVRAEAVNGHIRSALPINLTSQTNGRRLEGTLGSGGRQLALSTVNGSITLVMLKGQ
jgi:hypothetical protein